MKTKKPAKVLTITDLPRILPRLSRSKAIGILPDGTLELLPSWTVDGQLTAFNAGIEAVFKVVKASTDISDRRKLYAAIRALKRP